MAASSNGTFSAEEKAAMKEAAAEAKRAKGAAAKEADAQACLETGLGIGLLCGGALGALRLRCRFFHGRLLLGGKRSVTRCSHGGHLSSRVAHHDTCLLYTS